MIGVAIGLTDIGGGALILLGLLYHLRVFKQPVGRFFGHAFLKHSRAEGQLCP